MLSSETAKREIGQLHRKSVFRYIEKGNAMVYGSFKGYRASPKSRVGLTPLVNVLSKEGYKIRYTKPVMKTWEPWRIAALPMTNVTTDINNDILEECVQGFLNDILKKIPKDEIKQLHVYDNFTAINGAAGIAYVDKIKRNTSAGNPWKKSKKYFMHPAPPKGDLLDPVYFDDEIMSRVDVILSKYKQGERAMPNFCAHLKDEPVSFKKSKKW